ncbi:hypothetical protein EVG20_g1888 [Dentipellis fragilis]|uniref:non-specific serine/threonine protein kinase n=1 Tax=Dentipellis fragilis TaxID=205917 RepID=A0A4Y9Z8K0_9AGAM|nr:hypothetical protein EVG20_g1888 [Dentipellis fragilis]
MAAQTSSAVSVRQIYQCVEQVGKGAFGSVHRGRHIPSGKVVAIKIVDLDSEDADDDVLSMQREVALLTQLRGGPNIINYYGCFLDGPRVWIIMDYADGGSVRDFIENSPSEGIEEKFAVIITREVLVGLVYLHKCAVIHRDIKAANVLVTSTGKVLICDFGVSAILATTVGKRNTFIGTPFWMAPEIAAPSPSYDTKADIWSLGILVYEMIKGNPPHLGVAPLKLIQMLPTMKPARFLENEASQALREFLPLCLTEAPVNRFTADELLKTKWIKATAKVPVTSLRALLNRLAESKSDDVVPSENSDQNDQEFTGNDPDSEDPWEFETVRGLSSEKPSLNDASTIRAGPPSSKLPPSLRHIFDVDGSSTPDPFRIAPAVPNTFDATIVSPLPSLPPSTPRAIPASPSPSMARERRAAKRALTVDHGSMDGVPLSSATFSFPPKATPSRIIAIPPVTAEGTLAPPPNLLEGHMARSLSVGNTANASVDGRIHTRSDPSAPVEPLHVSRSQDRMDPDTSPNVRSRSATGFNRDGQLSSSGALSATPSIPNFGDAEGPGLSHRPSLGRLASVAVMESVPPPLKPSVRERSGSQVKDIVNDGTMPGLKNVLKTPSLNTLYEGGSSLDLLPPSFPRASRSRDPSPSTPSTPTRAVSRTGMNPEAPIAMPSSLPHKSAVMDLHRRNSSLPAFSAPMAGMAAFSVSDLQGPPIRLLDFGALQASHEAMHAELAQVVDDLGSWLSVVHVGLGRLLDSAGVERIVEEPGYA